MATKLPLLVKPMHWLESTQKQN